MKRHSSNIFQFDKTLTQKGYENLAHKFVEERIKKSYLNTLIKAMGRNLIDIGIDYNKPWEEICLNEKHFQIEYLFVGKLLIPESGYILDDEIGINIFPESRCGVNEFYSEDILNLTLMVEIG